MGCLLEMQTVGCFTEDLDLASVWWPLTSSLISKTLSVSRQSKRLVLKIKQFVGKLGCIETASPSRP